MNLMIDRILEEEHMHVNYAITLDRQQGTTKWIETSEIEGTLEMIEGTRKGTLKQEKAMKKLLPYL